MLADPNIYLTAFLAQTSTSGRLYALEVCDACEDDSLGYQIGTLYKTLVSDFVTPQWFEPADTSFINKRYDFLGHILTPFSLAPNGYISTFDIPNTNGWVDIFGKFATAVSVSDLAKLFQDVASGKGIVPPISISQNTPPLEFVPKRRDTRVPIRRLPFKDRLRSQPSADIEKPIPR
jgi:hypothetical protein